MADIYNRDVQKTGGVFTTEKSRMTLSGAGELGVGALVQSVTATYAQQINHIFELGSGNVYYAIGRPQGTLTIGRIVGKGDFGDEMFDACKGGVTVQFSALNGHCGAGEFGDAEIQATLHGVLATSYSIAMSTADLLVKEDIQATFASMEKK